jgi:hypothetical protein
MNFLLRNIVLIVAPWVALPVVWEPLPLSCRTSAVAPLGGGAGDLGASTINEKKY